MSEKIKNIYSESPEIEQWNLLEIYTYPTNIIKYFSTYEKETPTEEIINYIINSISQAKEYFFLSKKATLYTQPVLIYYGYINLLSAYYVMKNGEIPAIKNHGMSLLNINETIGDIKVHMNNEKEGALAIFNSLIGNIDFKKYRDLSIKELMSVIPEILDYFEISYPDENIHILPVEKIVHKNYTEDRVENRYIIKVDNSIYGLRNIKYINENYLNIQFSKDSQYTYLRRKITYKSNSVYSIFNRKYIPIPFFFDSNEIYVNREISMLMILYSLSVLCRYHPTVWNKFVKQDSSGENLLIQSFLNWCIRLIPNYILNKIENITIKFSTKEQGITNKKNSDEELKEMIEKITYNYIKERPDINGRF